MTVVEHTEFRCRSCATEGGELVLDLGMQPLANNLLGANHLESVEPRYPLRLYLCRSCWLLQIRDTLPPAQLFSEYIYFSSFSDAMLRHAREAAHQYITDFRLDRESFVVEIASNDGYLLKNFVERGVPSLGIEPAKNVARVARASGVETKVAFFGEKTAHELAKRKKADLILGNNVFAHAPNINDFAAGLRTLLKENGRTVLEFPYGGDFIERCEFDTIYHEHVFYFFLTPLVALFARHGLQIFDVAPLSIHGGSLRIFIGHADVHNVEDRVETLLKREEERGVRRRDFYSGFAERADRIRSDLLRVISELREDKKRIAAYGASAKGSTLLNFVQPPASAIEFIADRSTFKQGKYSPGLHLPIVADEELSRRQPDYTLLLTWNFADEILAQQKKYRSRGGKFIIPIPEVRVV